MTAGRHHSWRKVAVKLGLPYKKGVAVDLATGTGDFSFELLHYESIDEVVSGFARNIIFHYNKDNSIYKNDYAYVLAERESLSIEKLQYALVLAEKAVEMEPENSAYLDTLGWVNFKLGFYKKAQKYLEKSLKMNNGNPVILEHLADIYTKVNRFSDAIILYEKILSIDSENQKIKNKINKIYE